MSTVECYIDVDDDGGDGGVGGDGRYPTDRVPRAPRPPTADRRPSRTALLDKSAALEHMRPVTATEDFFFFLLPVHGNLTMLNQS